MNLRDCQREALEVIKNRYITNEKETNILMCTGSGKSLVIRNTINILSANKIFMVFPSLLLIQQYYRDHYTNINSKYSILYYATEGTLKDVPRLSDNFNELLQSNIIILTTYISATKLYNSLKSDIDIVIHDEAHHITANNYSKSYDDTIDKIKHTINFSATLPEHKLPHYAYSLLKGIKDTIVRDFNIELFLCRSDEPKDIVEVISRVIEWHKNDGYPTKMLVYTAEANTDNSSVKTFINTYQDDLKKMGMWIKGITADDKDRNTILRDFENHKKPSILVSCQTLSEGVDLKNANCTLFWDPSGSFTVIIQRIGRIVRKYKDNDGKEYELQPSSSIIVPIFIKKDDFEACKGDKEKVNELLEKQISEGERGNFRLIINVCAALKSELADKDSDLFNGVLHYPDAYDAPKVRFDKDLIECISKKIKKKPEDILSDIAEHISTNDLSDDDINDIVDEIREGIWNNEISGDIMNALTSTQDLTLLVNDGVKNEVYGKGKTFISVENDNGKYKISKKKHNVSTCHRVSGKISVNYTSSCKILLGISDDDIGLQYSDMIVAKLTMNVQDENWDKRLEEWVEQYNKLGKFPSYHSKDKDEKRAATWQSHQREDYKKNKIRMTKERIDKLNNTQGWEWEEDTWSKGLQNWIKQYKKYEKNPSVYSKDINEKRASQWQSNQRKNYKQNKITKEQINILNKTLGWKWEEDDKWNEQLTNWIEQYNKLGRNPYQTSKDKDERRAGQWQTDQRKYYKNNNHNRMTKERIDKLNKTLGWKWEEDDTWSEQLENWKIQVKELGRLPSQASENEDEKRAAKWQSHQKQYYKNNDTRMTKERIDKLNNTVGWKWDNDTWTEQLQNWIKHYNKLGKNPNGKSNDKDEKRAGIWQGNQKQYKKNNKLSQERIDILNKTEGWSWGQSDSSTIISASTTSTKRKKPQVAPEVTVEKPRRRRPLVAQTEENEKEKRERVISELEKFHKQFKTMNDDTYYNKLQENPELFMEYHNIANTYDNKDLPEKQPINRIAEILSPYNKKSYYAVDLRCGENKLRQHSKVDKMKWESVDVYAVDNTVTKANMGSLPFEDETFDIAILSRSLWARNHKDVLLETLRVLKSGGKAIICEAYRRWEKIENGVVINTLINELLNVGFTIIKEPDNNEEVFQYIIVRKD